MSFKKILITGTGGFVGMNLIPTLLKYYEVDGIDLHDKYNVCLNNFFTWSDLEKLDEYEIVIHLAGIAHDTSNSTESKIYYDVNLGLTKKIFDYFLKSDSEKFIFFSSVKAVSDSVNDNILTEDDAPGPKTPYGQSKLAAEQYILDQKLPPGKKVYILRPCMIHGPGNKGNLNLLYNIVKKGIPYPLGAFHNLRSFTSIENMIFIIREFIEKDIEPGIYQVADDEPISTNEIVELIASTLNKNLRIWKIPKRLIRTIAKTGDWIYFPLNSERLKKLTESYVVSNSKLKSAFGIKNLPVSVRNGLKYTFESFEK